MAPDRLLSEASNFQTRMERTTEELSDFQKGIMEAMRRADANQDRLGQERGGARTKNATKDEDIKWARMQATAIQSKLQLKNWARKEAWALDMFARCVSFFCGIDSRRSIAHAVAHFIRRVCSRAGTVKTRST